MFFEYLQLKLRGLAFWALLGQGLSYAAAAGADQFIISSLGRGHIAYALFVLNRGNVKGLIS
jgi:hypothetical protein